MAEQQWRLIWMDPALDDLGSIFDYVRATNPAAARRLFDRIRARAESLQTFPESGRIVPEFPHQGWRELIVGNHRLIYRLRPEARRVGILAVVHGARELTEDLVPDEG